MKQSDPVKKVTLSVKKLLKTILRGSREKSMSCVPLIPDAVRNLHTRGIADESQPDDHP